MIEQKKETCGDGFEANPSPELSFHLSNAFNELQASARILPEDDPRKQALTGIAAAVNVVRRTE